MAEKPVQLDLFGEVEKAEQDARDRAQAAAAWAARFERADWIAPWDTAGGLKKGDRVLGWRCPDPACGQIEPNATLLANDHGWDPQVPGREPSDGCCHRLRLLAAHRAYEARQQGKEPSDAHRRHQREGQ
jgi:hypothetical protein